MRGGKVKWEMSDGCICYCKSVSLSELNTVRESKTVTAGTKGNPRRRIKAQMFFALCFYTSPLVRAVLFPPSFVNFKEDSLSRAS